MSLVSFTAALSAPTIFTGDFNIHLDRSCADSEKFQSLLYSCDLVQHIDLTTHLHKHTLDLLISPSDFHGISKIKQNGFLLDHEVISCDLSIYPSSIDKDKVVTFRSWHKIDREKLKNDLLHTNFVSTPASSATDLYDQYCHDLTSLIDKHAPAKTKTIKRQTPSWITDEYRIQKRLRRQLERRWKKTNSVFDRSRLRRQINLCNQILSKNKKQFYTDLIQENSNDPKKLWKELNNVLHRKPEMVLPDSHDPKSLANEFCSFFENKITRIRSGFSNATAPDILPDRKPKIFRNFHAVTEEEVRKVILGYPTKSCSLDPWPTFLLKEYINILLPSITKLVNLCILDCQFPKCFKNAVVTPL